MKFTDATVQRRLYHTDDNVLEVASVDCERAWLPVLGPTAMVLVRFLDRLAPEDPIEEAVIAAASISQSIGLGAMTSHNSPLGRALARLRRFDAIHFETDKTGAIWIAAPRALPIPRRFRTGA